MRAAAKRRLESAAFYSETKSSNNQRILGSWNVRTMLSEVDIDEKGNPKVQGGGLGKLPNLIHNLSKYQVGLAAISEHRWKGKGEHSFDGWTFLFSGKGEDDTSYRKGSGGAGLLLSPDWVKAWKNAGSHVEYCSDRVMKARFKKHGRHITAISVYAPTHYTAQEQKDKFWDDLKGVIESTENGDILIILGDFNARVGRGGPDASPVLGTHGPIDVNDAGERLIEFCEEHNLMISSTCNPKAKRGSWFHAPSQKWYLIDHVLVKQRDATLVSQVIPIVPAECHTDHRLMRVKLQIKPLRSKIMSQKQPPKNR